MENKIIIKIERSQDFLIEKNKKTHFYEKLDHIILVLILDLPKMNHHEYQRKLSIIRPQHPNENSPIKQPFSPTKQPLSPAKQSFSPNKPPISPINQYAIPKFSEMPNFANGNADNLHAAAAPNQCFSSRIPPNIIPLGNKNNNNRNVDTSGDKKEVPKRHRKPPVYDSLVNYNQSCPHQELREVLNEFGYAYIEPIGAGGTATCFLVHSKKYDMFFVCKKIDIGPQVICSTCEMEALKILDHPQIINMYNYKQLDNSIYIFLEYCVNGSLYDYVHTNHKIITGKQLIALCYTLLKGLEYIHSENYAHLDIKPANLLVDKYGRVKIADFGISRFVDSTKRTSDQRAGTLLFMAPEIILSYTKGFDPFKADIWSMGVTFYFLASRRVPWKISSKEDYIKGAQTGNLVFPRGFPEQMQHLIRKMLMVDYRKRPSPTELLQDEIFHNVNPKDGYLTGFTTIDPKSPNSEIEKKEIINSELNDDNNIPDDFVCNVTDRKQQQELQNQQYQIFAQGQLSPRSSFSQNIADSLSPPPPSVGSGDGPNLNLNIGGPNFSNANASSSSRTPQRGYLSMNPNLKVKTPKGFSNRRKSSFVHT
ncbi:hypothetical protein TRFO_17219 [Tritrichomonas foetus]|uniref:Protein kinase domain-containing protein n=1 Tax=Tritrichomonas foetus TaxID=1144522 RepID=A0A1J4KTM8_9EUKA|nr:hypothetical protein TRFO_17219 [Tritrichomonas foetus]|eukprot:OHT12845.1 hypothetical protein TRFO_17219 [Tritrichomonas foetus]